MCNGTAMDGSVTVSIAERAASLSAGPARTIPRRREPHAHPGTARDQPRRPGQAIREGVFQGDDMMTYAAALSYSALFALFPFLIFLIASLDS